MKHIRLLSLIILLTAVCFQGWSQTQFSVIPVTAEGEISEEAANIVSRKIGQILTRNSACAAGAADVFAVRANLAVTDKSASSGLVREISSALGELTLTALNKVDGAEYYSISVPVKAVTKSGGEAGVIVALAKAIKPTDSVYTRFVRVAREKIAEYYSGHCNDIIARAKNLIQSGQAETARIYLSGISPAAPCHDEALELLSGLSVEEDSKK